VALMRYLDKQPPKFRRADRGKKQTRPGKDKK
jgi:hypothetical protein